MAKSKNLEVLILESPEDLTLLEQYIRFNTNQQLKRVDEIDSNVHPVDRILQEQVRAYFREFVNNEMDVRLMPLSNPNITSLIIKKEKENANDSLKEEIKEIKENIENQYFLDGKNIKTFMVGNAIAQLKDRKATKILVLNENNLAVQRLCEILTNGNVTLSASVLLPVAKALFFMAFIFSGRQLAEDDLNDYAKFTSKIISEYCNLTVLDIDKR